MKNTSQVDLRDNQQLDDLRLETLRADRETLIEALTVELAAPLPQDLEGKAKAVMLRQNIYDQIKRANSTIEMAEYQWKPPPPEGLSLITDTDPPPPEWLVENWLPRSELTVFTGIGGLGKSHIMLNLAVALASGCSAEYLDPQGTPNPDRAERTLFATWEDSYNSAKRRVKKIQQTFAGWFDANSVKEKVIFQDMKAQGQIWVPASESGHISNRGMMTRAGHELLKSCENKHVSLLVLDSIAAIFGQDLNSAAHVRPFLNYLSAWANDKEITICLIGHPNKSGEGGPSGSADWHNGVRSRWELVEAEKIEGTGEESKKSKRQQDKDKPNNPTTYYALKHAKANDAPMMPDIPLIRNINGIYEMATGKDAGTRVIKAINKYKEYKDHWANYNPQENTANANSELTDLIAASL